ncbi:unnamed protein product, partial [Urochloa humidicola]
PKPKQSKAALSIPSNTARIDWLGRLKPLLSPPRPAGQQAVVDRCGGSDPPSCSRIGLAIDRIALSMGMEMEVKMETEAETDRPDDGNATKACADCHTTKTPLWRGGPEGPKSLCNACGIRYRKRRRQALALTAAAPQKDDKAADQQEEDQPKKKAADPQEEEEEEQPPRKKAADQQQQPPRKKAADLQEDQQQQPPKKKAATDQQQEDQQQQPPRKKAASSSTNNKKEKDKDRKRKDRQVTVELRVVGFGKEVMLKQRRQMRSNKCMSEEERAAVLLMAMSSGVIYAS